MRERHAFSGGVNRQRVVDGGWLTRGDRTERSVGRKQSINRRGSTRPPYPAARLPSTATPPIPPLNPLYLSLLQSPLLHTRTRSRFTAMPTTLKEFESVWPRIVADLEAHCKSYKLPQQPLDWFVQVRRIPPGPSRPLSVSPALTRDLRSVPQLQHSRRKMQPRHVCR